MVSLAEIATIAVRYDTAMSCAMLRALADLGVRVTPPRCTRAYDHLMECFRNHGSPMDGVR